MNYFLGFLLLLIPASLAAEDFSCPAGQADIMKYFVLDKEEEGQSIPGRQPQSDLQRNLPDSDFARSGYWFWLKSPKAHGFDVKSFDQQYIYLRSTELNWKDNTSFKRFVRGGWCDRLPTNGENLLIRFLRPQTAFAEKASGQDVYYDRVQGGRRIRAVCPKPPLRAPIDLNFRRHRTARPHLHRCYAAKS